MVTSHDDVRSICARFPGALEGEDRFGFSAVVKGKAKGFCWTWMERVEPKKPKVENPRVLAIRVPNLQAKEMLIAALPEVFFDEPHYHGYPAVLTRLDAADPEDLADVLEEGWRAVLGPGGKGSASRGPSA